MTTVIIHRWHRGIIIATIVIDRRCCWRIRYRRRDRGGSGFQILADGITERDHALVVLNDTRIRNIECIPLRPVKGIVHKGLHLIPTEHREVVDVMIDGNAFDRSESVGPSVHPAAVMRFHFESVNEGVDNAVLLKVVGISFVTKLTNHVHHLVSHRGGIFHGSCGALNVGKDLWIVGFVRDPPDLRTLHCIPESNSEEVVAPGLTVIGQRFGKRPLADLFHRHGFETEEGSEVVVCLMGFGGDGRSSSDQLIMFRVVVRTMEGSPRGNIDVVTGGRRRLHRIMGTMIVSIVIAVVIHRRRG